VEAAQSSYQSFHQQEKQMEQMLEHLKRLESSMNRRLETISEDLKEHVLGRQISDLLDKHRGVIVQDSAIGKSEGIAQVQVAAPEEE
jgi:hypothetical protein